MRNAAVSAGKIVLFFAVSMGLVTGYIVWLSPLLGLTVKEGASPAAEVAFEGAQLTAMVLTAGAMMMMFDRKMPADWGMRLRGLGSDFATGAIIGCFIFLAALGLAFAYGWARLDLPAATFSMSALGVSAVVMVAHAAMEEVMMRGYVLQELMSKFSTATAVVVSSIIFTALHAGGLVQDSVGIVGAVNIFTASVLMSLAYLRTGALWLPIGIHAGWNFTQGPLLGINVSGNDLSAGWHPVAFEGSKWVTGGRFGFEASVPGLLGPVLGLLLLLAFVRPAPSEAAPANR